MPTYTPPPHTHPRQQKKHKTSTLECKENGQILNISDHKNVYKSKNQLTPLKLYNKKHDKKVMDSRGGLGWGDKIDRPGRNLFPSSIRKKPSPFTFFLRIKWLLSICLLCFTNLLRFFLSPRECYK